MFEALIAEFEMIEDPRCEWKIGKHPTKAAAWSVDGLGLTRSRHEIRHRGGIRVGRFSQMGQTSIR